MKNRGYTLLFAVLTAALVLGVAVFIVSVSKRQYDLAVTARESIYAFYAADSGIECATAAHAAGTIASNTPAIINCVGDVSEPVVFVSDSNYDQSLWSSAVTEAADIHLNFLDDRCAIVTVTYGRNLSGDPVTRIVSRGYNLCDIDGPKPSIRTVERALRLTKSGW